MKIDLNVDVHHLTRVEGHGNIHVRVRAGKVEEARWDVVETPRFFEVMLKGKHYTTAGILSARICGICSIGHCLASVRATESAFGLEVPEAAKKLRLLAKHGETLQSHVLHLFFLAAPDFLGAPSVLPLVEKAPEAVKLAVRLKGAGNRLCDAVAGRTTHPVSLQVGGVAVLPPRARLLALRDELERTLPDLAAAADLIAGFDVPRFERETEFVSLRGESEYPFIGGRLVSSDGVARAEHEYREMTNEYAVASSTSKWCRLSRASFAVGPLARFNNNHRLLHAEAKKLAARLGLEPVCHNPFMANVARLVECVHVTHDAIRLLEETAAMGEVKTMADVAPRAGEGVGAVEVPRGILYHHYAYDGDGRIARANCVIPTTQNNANIHHDLPVLAERFAVDGMTDEKLELLCSMLVRSYDPCISCSVH
ncbi:MAG: Ni/Fe hydrogenase subunit alpha [Planctomycetes bacterium]|nr:Ni/Fe hydrogenase subunit alpha [Planctomycetota bacterium]